MNSRLKDLIPDGYIIALVGMVVLASVLPVRGEVARVFELTTDGLIALLFFLHGAKLSRQAIVQGMSHWRLHLLVLASTYLLFPALGFGARAVAGPFLDPSLAAGLLRYSSYRLTDTSTCSMPGWPSMMEAVPPPQ